VKYFSGKSLNKKSHLRILEFVRNNEIRGKNKVLRNANFYFSISFIVFQNEFSVES
jgi:hypothetical protein